MRQFTIPLKDVVVQLESEQTLVGLPTDEATAKVRELYSFLPGVDNIGIRDGNVVVSMRDVKPSSRDSATKSYQKGVSATQSGEYIKAIDLFGQAVRDLPEYTNARRNLAMAYLESGDVVAAKRHLIEVLRLSPYDQWALLLAANFFMKYDKNHEVAARYYDKAYTIDPSDPYILTSYGGALIEMGKAEHAREMFDEALAADPNYPNAHLGLVMLGVHEQDPQATLLALNNMFLHSSCDDPRSRPVLAQGREIFSRLMDDLAGASGPAVQELIDSRKQEVEELSGHGIDIAEESALNVPSRTELAWKYNRERHRILHKPASTAVVAHQVLRSIEHADMETEARATGRNQFFISTAGTREKAISSIGKDIYKLRDQGIPEHALTEYVNQIVTGIVLQLYNCPLDMAVEYRLFMLRPVIRPCQFISLRATLADNLKAITSREIRRATPRIIYNASAAMNYAYALFVDSLYEGKTQFASAYPDGDYRRIGEELHGLWLAASADFSPGDEYALMLKFAEKLGLEGWFELSPDVTETTFDSYNPPATDEERLKKRDPATMMYLLGALERFSKMNDDEVRQVAMEVSVIGMGGITFTDPDERYALRSLPGEDFTGLQVLALMYVGWQRVDPSVDTGLDFKDLYATALALFQKRV